MKIKNWFVYGLIALLILGGAHISVIPIPSTIATEIDLPPEKQVDAELWQTEATERNYEIGDAIWQYTLTIYDPSPKAIAPIPDINGDGIGDVIVCSQDDFVRCFNGGAIGTGSILWEHDVDADVNSQKGLAITQDINNDGYLDVVIGTEGGTYNGRLIRILSGATGSPLWTHDTHEYGDGGWVYQVDCRYDYNNDGVLDVLATTGDDGTDTGPKRVYCLNGLTGVSIWERFLGGPVYAVIGIQDCTGDGHPDVIAGASNELETAGFAYGINGLTGNILWTFPSPGSSVWAVEQIDDITGDGIKDVIIGDFSGNIRGLNSVNGSTVYSNKLSSSSVIITRFEKLDDVNNDGHPDIVPAILGSGSSVGVKVINGQTGQFIWSHSVADQPAVVDRITDISGDGINDLLVGTLYTSNYCYFLNGTNGNELAAINYGEALDAIAAIPDVAGDGSMEMVAGGRDGLVTCFSGGLNASANNPPTVPILSGPTNGFTGETYDFTVIATDPENEYLFLMVDWDDGTPPVWYGPIASGTPFSISHSWTNPGIYPIKAKAKDINNAESNWSSPWTIAINAVLNMTLSPGWNLITVPVETTWTAESLGGNITGCSVVLMFNATTQTFLTHVVGTPWDDFPLLDGVGYFVYVTSGSSLEVTGPPITSVTVPISSGWNILGWYKEAGTTAESLGANITGCSTVLMFDAVAQTFLTHVVGTPWDNFAVTQGMGLFLYTTSASDWHGEG